MYTLQKEERLCNKKLIDGLFHNGSSFLCYPFKVSWSGSAADQSFPVQVLFSVSKKRFKRATDRNLLKRRMREAYRLNKQTLLYDPLTGSDKHIALSIGYIGKEISEFDFMLKKMVKLLTQLGEQVSK